MTAKYRIEYCGYTPQARLVLFALEDNPLSGGFSDLGNGRRPLTNAVRLRETVPGIWRTDRYLEAECVPVLRPNSNGLGLSASHLLPLS